MRALLILNEKSRLGAREAPLVYRTLEGHGIQYERNPSARDVDVVIAAGGDGTVVWSLPVAIARGVPLAVIPLGTFNDLARTLGIPLDVRGACAAILSGKKRRIDVGRVNGIYFVNEASVGLTTRIARKQTPEVKQRLGVLGVISTTLQSLNQTRPFSVELEYDGTVERFRTVQLTIANSAHFGGIFERIDASIDDGWLDLYSIEVDSWVNALGVVRKMIMRDPTPGEGLRTRRSTRFVVRTGHQHHIAADGEPAGMTPATFDILPHAVDVIVA